MSDKSAFICTGISRQIKKQQTKLLIFFKSQLLLFHLSSVQEPILFVFLPPGSTSSTRIRIQKGLAADPDPKQWFIQMARKCYPICLCDGGFGSYLNCSNNLELGRSPEVDALLPEEQPQISGHVPPRHVHAHDAVRHREPLVDRHLRSNTTLNPVAKPIFDWFQAEANSYTLHGQDTGKVPVPYLPMLRSGAFWSAPVPENFV